MLQERERLLPFSARVIITGMPDAPNSLVFLPRRGPLILNSIICCLFTAVLWLMIGLAIKNQQTRGQVMLLIFIGLVLGSILSIPLAVCLAHIWFRLVIQLDGVQIRSVRRGVEFIPWSDLRWTRLTLHPSGGLCAGIGLPGRRRLWVHEAWLADVKKLAEEIASRARLTLDVSNDLTESDRYNVTPIDMLKVAGALAVIIGSTYVISRWQQEASSASHVLVLLPAYMVGGFIVGTGTRTPIQLAMMVGVLAYFIMGMLEAMSGQSEDEPGCFLLGGAAIIALISGCGGLVGKALFSRRSKGAGGPYIPMHVKGEEVNLLDLGDSVKPDPIRMYTSLYLLEMASTVEDHRTVRQSQPLTRPEGYEGDLPAFSAFVDYLKYLAQLEPVMSQQPQEGAFDMFVGGRGVTVRVRTEDNAPDRTLILRMEYA